MRIGHRVLEIAKTPLRPFRHGAVAISRHVMLDYLVAKSDVPTNLVISTGGAGTTFLMKHLAHFVRINDPYNKDRVKHLPRLPTGWLEDRRVLYVYSKPETVFLSIQRRCWVHMHAGELGCLSCQFALGRLRRRKFEEAVRKQIDTFHSYRSANVMLLDYEDIWARVGEISDFFGIDDARFVSDFPPRRPRRSQPS